MRRTTSTLLSPWPPPRGRHTPSQYAAPLSGTVLAGRHGRPGRRRRLEEGRELAFGLKPIVDIATMFSAPLVKQIVRLLGNVSLRNGDRIGDRDRLATATGTATGRPTIRNAKGQGSLAPCPPVLSNSGLLDGDVREDARVQLSGVMAADDGADVERA